MTIRTGLVSDEEIVEVFKHASYVGQDPRKLLQQGVLKKQAGYMSGHTLTRIMQKLELLTHEGEVTKKGKLFLLDAFEDETQSG